MQIVQYPHPALRHKSKPVRRVDAELRKIIAQMFELMYQSQGIGLAANQVDLPLRFFIMNLGASPDEGEELVFINPVLSRPRGRVEMDEGCLSFPELYAPVWRPEKITIEAFNLSGEQISLEVDKMLARVVQHETDHVEGVLFTDRVGDPKPREVVQALEEFEAAFRQQRSLGMIPSDEEIAKRLMDWEQRYC